MKTELLKGVSAEQPMPGPRNGPADLPCFDAGTVAWRQRPSEPSIIRRGPGPIDP